MTAGDASAGRSTLRTALRTSFRGALERLAAAGTMPLEPGELPDLLAQVRETADAKFGDYSGTMAMALAKRAGRKPREVAAEIAREVAADPGYGGLFAPPGDPVGPGFINVRVRDDALATAVGAAVRDERMGVPRVERPERIVIDYSSPNVAKPMHRHARA